MTKYAVKMKFVGREKGAIGVKYSINDTFIWDDAKAPMPKPINWRDWPSHPDFVPTMFEKYEHISSISIQSIHKLEEV